MSCLSIHPPTCSNWVFAFGWVPTTQDHTWQKKETRWVLFNNLANFASYVLSPIIGLIRIIVNAYFLAKNENIDDEEWEDNEKLYLKAQISRGVAELFGAGYLMWIPDLISSIYIKCTNKMDKEREFV